MTFFLCNKYLYYHHHRTSQSNDYYSCFVFTRSQIRISVGTWYFQCVFSFPSGKCWHITSLPPFATFHLTSSSSYVDILKFVTIGYNLYNWLSVVKLKHVLLLFPARHIPFHWWAFSFREKTLLLLKLIVRYWMFLQSYLLSTHHTCGASHCC